MNCRIFFFALPSMRKLNLLTTKQNIQPIISLLFPLIVVCYYTHKLLSNWIPMFWQHSIGSFNQLSTETFRSSNAVLIKSWCRLTWTNSLLPPDIQLSIVGTSRSNLFIFKVNWLLYYATNAIPMWLYLVSRRRRYLILYLNGLPQPQRIKSFHWLRILTAKSKFRCLLKSIPFQCEEAFVGQWRSLRSWVCFASLSFATKKQIKWGCHTKHLYLLHQFKI